jgi:hypothetical protein
LPSKLLPYLATKASAAISEMRPWVGSFLTLAQFKTTRILKMVDCSENTIQSFALQPHNFEESDKTEEVDPSTKEKGVWGGIGYAFSRPVTHEEPHLDYVPTQFLAEAFRGGGYDGIIYRSLLDKEGRNIALFDLSSATVVSRCLYRTKQVTVTCVKQESEHSTWPEAINSQLADGHVGLNWNDL